LSPGGYIELQDVLFPTRSLDSTRAEQHALTKYSHAVMKGMAKMGFDFNAPKHWPEQLKAVGFVDIHVKWTNCPIGCWPVGAKNKLMGKLEMDNFSGAVDVVKPVFQALGMSDKESQALIDDARADILEQKGHQYLPFCFISAKKSIS
jgi:hypothetical protein